MTTEEQNLLRNAIADLIIERQQLKEDLKRSKRNEAQNWGWFTDERDKLKKATEDLERALASEKPKEDQNKEAE